MDIVGYGKVKQNAPSIKAANPEKFFGKTVRVMEFADDGGILCICSDASEMAMVEPEDVLTSFKCFMFGEIPVPPNLTDMVSQGMYAMYCNNRKGGYPPIISNMVIEASLMKGKFCDSMLWQLQDEQHAWKHNFKPLYKVHWPQNRHKNWTDDLQKVQDYVKILKVDCLNFYNQAEISVDLTDGSHVKTYNLDEYVKDNWYDEETLNSEENV